MDGALNGRITAVDDAFGFFFCLVQDFATGSTQHFGISLIFLNQLFKFLLFLSDGKAFVFPVAFVAIYVKQIFV